jgi:hypothetical protein
MDRVLSTPKGRALPVPAPRGGARKLGAARRSLESRAGTSKDLTAMQRDLLDAWIANDFELPASALEGRSVGNANSMLARAARKLGFNRLEQLRSHLEAGR